MWDWPLKKTAPHRELWSGPREAKLPFCTSTRSATGQSQPVTVLGGCVSRWPPGTSRCLTGPEITVQCSADATVDAALGLGQGPQTHLHAGGAALHGAAEHDSSIFGLLELNGRLPQADGVWNMFKGWERSDKKTGHRKAEADAGHSCPRGHSGQQGQKTPSFAPGQVVRLPFIRVPSHVRQTQPRPRRNTLNRNRGGGTADDRR